MPRHLETLTTLAANLAGNHPAILTVKDDELQSLTYTDLAAQVQQTAAGLQQAGVQRGDIVAVLGSSSPAWITACLAALYMGAVAAPVDAQLDEAPLTHILNDACPRLVFTTTKQVERLRRLALDADPQWVLLDAPADDPQSWHNLRAAADDFQPVQPAPEDTAALFYTSGTTGAPKGVPLTHRNITFEINTLLEADLITADDRVLQPLPLHHVYPLVVGVLAPLAAGLPVLLPQSLTGPSLIRAIREGKVTIIMGVPRLYRALYDGIQERASQQNAVISGLLNGGMSLSTWMFRQTGIRAGRWFLRPLHQQLGASLRLLVSGGAPLDPDLAEKLAGMGWQVAIGYGLTETSPILTIHMPNDTHLDSVGKIVAGAELRLTGDDAPAEIQARGPNIFSGYRHLPDETAATFTEDGWFKTGDLGTIDDAGYLHITGRASTRIVTPGGENIQPDDVEAAYSAQPVIAEVGVLQRDERLVAIIVPDMEAVRQRSGDINQDVRIAVDTAAQHLPSYQQLSDYVVTRQPLPRTTLGDLRRHLLAERYEQAAAPKQEAAAPVDISDMSEDDRALLENDAARTVWAWLAERYPDMPLSPDTHLQLDLGVDSLAWVNLTLEIEQRVGVTFTDEALARIDMVRDLLEEVAAKTQDEADGTQAHPLEQPDAVLRPDEKHWLEPLSPPMRGASRVFHVTNGAFVRGYFRLHVEGLERLPRERPFVLTPNHTSFLDPFVIAAALDYPLLRRTYWIGAGNMAFRNALFRFGSRLAQTLPVDRQRSGTTSLAFGAAVLQRGNNLIWFPEGHRSHTGELKPFRPGVGLLLARYDVLAVPATIAGAHDALPPGRTVPRPVKIRVTFGSPTTPDELDAEGEGDETHERIANALHDRLLALLKNAPKAPRFIDGDVGRENVCYNDKCQSRDCNPH